MFDLDEAPEDSDEDDDDMDDEFDIGSEDDDEMLEDDEVDSAFASSNEGEDEEMEDDDLPPPHLRPNPIPTEDEDGLITNLEDDLENDGFTLPVVEGGGEQEEHEHGTSLRHTEARMRWLVRVCAGKDEKVTGIPGR